MMMPFLYFLPVLEPAGPGSARAGTAAEEKLRALGAHLSGECVACHNPAGSRGQSGRGGTAPAGARTEPGGHGAPNITGLDPEVFIRALKDYRDRIRSNPVMVSVARSLTEDEMSALAMHFHGVKPKERR